MATRVSPVADKVSTDIRAHQHLIPLNQKFQIVCVSPPWQRSMKPQKRESIDNSTSLVFGLLLKVLLSGQMYPVKQNYKRCGIEPEYLGFYLLLLQNCN